MTAESPGTKLIKQAFEGLTGSIKLPPTPSPYYNPPTHFKVKTVEFEKAIPGIGKGGRVPDILLTDVEGRKLVVELYNTNPKTDDWTQDVASVGLLAVEVDVYNLKPDFRATYVERVSEILRNARWLNPGSPADLKWAPYTNILSYHQSCETGFVLERDGQEILVLVLFDRGKWRSVVGRGKIHLSEVIGDAKEDIRTAVQDAWTAVHPGIPLSDVPPCPNVYFTGLDISDPRLMDFWDKYDRCAECLGVISGFGLVLNLGAHMNGQQIRVITPGMFPLNRDPWAGYPLRLYLRNVPNKLYCWLCAALHKDSAGWKFLSPDEDSAPKGDPSDFGIFCNWKLAQAEERRRVRYQKMRPGRRPDDPGVLATLNAIEESLDKDNLEASLRSLRSLRTYQPEGRARAVKLAQQVAQGWFRQLPYPLQQAISAKGVDSE